MAATTWRRLARWMRQVGPNWRTRSENAPTPVRASGRTMRRFISPDAFDPDGDYVPTSGLSDRIQAYTGAGRYRSALDELFAVLDRKPGDHEALRLATIVLGSIGRTQHVTAV